ncbi:hypothetical protein DL96DRAFT_567318 [Flagelloscypha sp. PMI_526]|nr:hypothetical protein DL96DRAFT_567318 [Flagelloscypha sp. PMI_526]
MDSYLLPLALNHMVAQLIVTLIYGIYFPVFVAGFRILLRRARQHSQPPRFLLIMSSLIFISTTAFFILTVTRTMNMFFAPQSNLEFILRYDASKWPLEVMGYFLQAFNFTAGNTVLIWRACILWKRSNWVPFGLWALLASQIAISTADAINRSIVLGRLAGTNVSPAMNFHIPSMFISLAVNFIATLFVIAQTWRYRQTLQSTAIRKSSVFEILSLLIECGFCLCTIQLIHAVFTILRGKGPGSLQWIPVPAETFALSAPITPFLVVLAGICPSLIILLTARKDSIGKAYAMSTSMSRSSASASTQQNSGHAEIKFTRKPHIGWSDPGISVSTTTHTMTDQDMPKFHMAV